MSTRIIIERDNGTQFCRRIYVLPNDTHKGFFGRVEITLQSGMAVALSIPRETLEYEEEIITK